MCEARLLALRENIQHDPSICSTVSRFPAAARIVREKAVRWLEELRAEISSGEVAAALKDAKELEPGCAFQRGYETG